MAHGKKLLEALRGLLAFSSRKKKIAVGEIIGLGHAKGRIIIQRPHEHVDGEPAYRDDDGNLVVGRRWIVDPALLCQVPDPRDVETLHADDSLNVKTNAGIDFLHHQGYGTSGLGTNGLNWIALSDDALTENGASTTLSTEIASNGLSRAQGAVAHTGGTTTTTIAHTFTATGAQSAKKAALFTLVAGGTMNHALAFTERTLQAADTILVTFTITLS